MDADHLTTLRAGLSPGYNRLLDRTTDADMGLDFGVEVVRAGEARTFRTDGVETAVLVLRGAGTLRVIDPQSGARADLTFSRTSWIEEAPTAAHAPAGVEIELAASTDCEVAIVGTENSASFPPRLYAATDVPTEHRGKGILDDAAYRLVRCVFDRTSAPAEARLVLGEVVAFPGKWSSYPPHHHPQPEIYYYRFHPEHGYGHGECGERVYPLKQHDLLRIRAGADHAQVAAPGYHMYYLWAIRHLPGRPYTGFEFAPEHKGLLEKR